MKHFFIIVGSLLLIIFIVLTIAYFNGAYIISRILSSQLDAKVTIQHVDLGWNAVEIDQLKVKNPTSGGAQYALEVGEIDIKAPVPNYFKKTVVIDYIGIENIFLNLDIAGSGKDNNNWSALMSNIYNMKNPSISSNSSRHAIIKYLEIKNLKIRIHQAGKKPIVKTINHMAFKDIRTENGELTRRIIQAILARLVLDVKNFIDIPEQIQEGGVKGFFKGMKDKLHSSGLNPSQEPSLPMSQEKKNELRRKILPKQKSIA